MVGGYGRREEGKAFAGRLGRKINVYKEIGEPLFMINEGPHGFSLVF